MKKSSSPILLLILTVLLGCRVYQIYFGGDIKNVEISIDTSDKYSEAGIDKAMNVVLKTFQKKFKGCTLKRLEYKNDCNTETWEKMYATDEVIVITSEFVTDSRGVDGSFNPEQVYTDWEWILIKSRFGNRWKLVNYGYG